MSVVIKEKTTADITPPDAGYQALFIRSDTNVPAIKNSSNTVTDILTSGSTLSLSASASPTVSTNGDIAVDTTVADFSHGLITFYGGEAQFVISVPTAALTSPSDGTAVVYNATNDEFELGAIASGTAGLHEIYIAAASMIPHSEAPCSDLATVNGASGQPDINTLDFDATTQEYAQFSIRMPKSWNEGTVTFTPHWSHAATTTNFGVVWSLQAVAVSNDDAIAASFGTAQTSTDTGGTTSDLYTGPTSSAITIAGTPAEGDMVFFRVSRVTGDGSDTMAIDARLHGITLNITTDAENDA